MKFALFLPAILILTAPALAAPAADEIYLASGAALSPDGTRLAFSWLGDLWIVDSGGGTARRLTRHPAADSTPLFSPDGEEIAFISERFPGGQVFVMGIAGGEPEQLTFDTNGYGLMDWYPDGKSLLVRAASDRSWVDSYRFYRIDRTRRAAPEMVMDAEGGSASLSDDGQQLLFAREGVAWWRKGYVGPQASQIWLADLAKRTHRKVVHERSGSRWPLFLPGGDAFLYVGEHGGALNLLERDLTTGKILPLTEFTDDTVVAPALSRDGRVVVFRHLFDLYRMRLGLDGEPQRISIKVTEEEIRPRVERRLVRRADQAAFTADGLEIAVIAGGDLWVMDTVLREPVKVIGSAEQEHSPVFTVDHKGLLFIRDTAGESDIWMAKKGDPAKWWWQQEGFRLHRVTRDAAEESALTVDPTGKRIAWVRGNGQLVTRLLAGGEESVLCDAHGSPSYSWSPDGRFIAYAVDDEDSNRDVWVRDADAKTPAVNISRHPYDDHGPVWSADGRILAFTGVRRERESDIHIVYLFPEDEQVDSRARSLEKAVQAMGKGRRSKSPPKPANANRNEKAKDKEKPTPDFENAWKRVRRISIADTREGSLLFAPTGQKLVFSASIAGKRGMYQVEFPSKLKPTLLTTTIGSSASWPKAAGKLLWLVNGTPTASAGPRNSAYPFTVRIERDRHRHQALGFDEAWNTMRNWFYDERMNNRDWDAIREKYRRAAARAPDSSTFGRVISLMLGELNASHLGFSASREAVSGWRDQWTVSTGDLGLWFDPEYPGPGLRVSRVIREGPCDRERSRLQVGEIVLRIDGQRVALGMDLTRVLNVVGARDVQLTVADSEGMERQVAVRPTNRRAVRGLLYRTWLDDCRRKVDELSKGTLGYVHVAGMNWGSFAEFERGLFAAGYGKKGLVIDVRWNGGGFTADHLLTALTQPAHAIAVQRGDRPGYPQDRTVYATWKKPIVVLCNQSSFSNAEIFAHAIKTLKRGRLVGVQTAGGVISTSGSRILDLGTIRIPLRGWFVIDTGEDMELNGAMPDFELWPEPGELANGIDRQLDKAIEVLLEDVKAYEARPRPKLRYASERRKAVGGGR